MDIWLSWATHRCAKWKPEAPIKGIFSSASSSTDKSVHIFSFFVSIIWEENMLRCIIMQKITFPLGTQLRRSKQACFNRFSFPHIIYLTLCCVF